MTSPDAREPVQPAPEHGRRRVQVLVAILVALTTFSAFLPALQNQFVNWDDDGTLLNNPHYRGLGWTQLRWMWTAFHLGHWIPLTRMTYGVDYLLWGMNPFGYHLTSLLLHTANAVALYFVALRLLGLALPGRFGRSGAGPRVAAALAALLFALHPLRVESVAWATERRDVLSGLFYLLTILAYLRAEERGARARGWYWASVGLCACALLSKSMAVSLPVVLVLLDIYPLGRLGGPTGWWGPAARRVYAEKIPFVLLAAAAAAIAFLALSQLDNMAPLDALGVGQRLAISAYSLSFYLWKTVAPFNLSPLYPMPGQVNVWDKSYVLSYGVVLGVTALALALRRRVPGLLVVWAAYVVTLLPVVGLFQNGPQIAADRFTYLANLGSAMLAGAGLLWGWSRGAVPLMTGLAVCIVLGLGVLTWGQTGVWHDTEKLWTHALSIDPQSPRPHDALGNALASKGKLAEAIAHYREALRFKPDFADAHNNLGNALTRQGKPEEAIAHFQEALRLKPDFAAAHTNWGVALTRQGKPAEASAHYRLALLLSSDFPGALGNRGWVLAQQGKLEEAIEDYREALHFRPDFAEAHNNLGNALARQGKLAEAIAHYREALRLRPDFAEAHNNLGWALARQGKLAEAIEHYQRALSLRPGFPDAHSNLRSALARQGRQGDGGAGRW